MVAPARRAARSTAKTVRTAPAAPKSAHLRRPMLSNVIDPLSPRWGRRESYLLSRLLRVSLSSLSASRCVAWLACSSSSLHLVKVGHEPVVAGNAVVVSQGIEAGHGHEQPWPASTYIVGVVVGDGRDRVRLALGAGAVGAV